MSTEEKSTETKTERTFHLAGDQVWMNPVGATPPRLIAEVDDAGGLAFTAPAYGRYRSEIEGIIAARDSDRLIEQHAVRAAEKVETDAAEATQDTEAGLDYPPVGRAVIQCIVPRPVPSAAEGDRDPRSVAWDVVFGGRVVTAAEALDHDAIAKYEGEFREQLRTGGEE